MASAAAAFTAGSVAITQNPHPELLPVVIIASLMPDADHPKSKVGRRMTKLVLPSALTLGFGWYFFQPQITPYLPYLIIPLIVGLLPYILYYIIGHRTVTHSVFIAGPLFGLAAYTLNPWLLAFAVGYALHMLGDYIFDEGIVLFWPIKDNRYRAPITFKTNGVLEWLIMISSWMIVIMIYLPYLLKVI